MFLQKKPVVTEKLFTYLQHLREHGRHGTVIRGFQINYSNRCNFNCDHCFTDSPAYSLGDPECEKTMGLFTVRRLADQAHDLGAWEIDIQGGEPLLIPELEEMIRAFGPERFYIYMTTNGWLLTEEKALRLADCGLDKISVSLDSLDPEVHDLFRGRPGAAERALAALDHAKTAGLTANINITAGHANILNGEIDRMLAFAQDKGYVVNINMATPTGRWQGKTEVMADASDTARLQELRKKYRCVTRDLWAFHDPERLLVTGCPAVNIFYVNPLGDVLPCPYIQIRMGNIQNEPLGSILERGWRIPWFADHSSLCLAGENLFFATRYLNGEMSVMKPMDMDLAFNHNRDELGKGGSV